MPRPAPVTTITLPPRHFDAAIAFSSSGRFFAGLARPY
jgi:hypothetical protein